MATEKEIPVGQQRPSTTWGDYNNVAFAIQQALGKLETATLVKVVSCTNNGGISPVGLVDVIPMVHQVDAAGMPMPHVTIFNVPYFRLQGGKNAIIIDPEPGDIGIAVFASRDITKVKATKAPANPGSARQYSFSDALYLGGVLNSAPAQYAQFNASGITIHSPSKVTIEAPSVNIQCQTLTVNASSGATITTPTLTLNGQLVQAGGGSATFSGSMAVAGDVTAQGTSVHSHVHGGVQPGGGTSGGPV